MASKGRGVAWLLPGKRIGGSPSDLEGTYRQVTACPLHALDFAFASWDQVAMIPVLFLEVSQPFGSGNVPLNFTRYQDVSCRASFALLGVAASHCVDDMLVLEIMDTNNSAFSGL